MTQTSEPIVAEQPAAVDRDQRTEQAHVGSWNVSASYSGPYKGYGAQIDLYAFAAVDNAICSYHLGLPLEAGRALYAALRAVLYPADEAKPDCLFCGDGAHWSQDCPTVTTAMAGLEDQPIAYTLTAQGKAAIS